MQPGTTYDFTHLMSSAYDVFDFYIDPVTLLPIYNPPMKLMLDGRLAIYGGDVNQDGAIDGGDMNEVDNGSFNHDFGYKSADCTGEGEVSGGDMNIIDNNNVRFLFYARPY